MKQWLVHEEMGKLQKGDDKFVPVYYFKYDKIFYGTTLNKELAFELVAAWNAEDLRARRALSP